MHTSDNVSVVMVCFGPDAPPRRFVSSLLLQSQRTAGCVKSADSLKRASDRPASCMKSLCYRFLPNLIRAVASTMNTLLTWLLLYSTGGSPQPVRSPVQCPTRA